jgi:hypothetical protein
LALGSSSPCTTSQRKSTDFPGFEKLVAPLIAAPNEEMRKWEDKGQGKNA